MENFGRERRDVRAGQERRLLFISYPLHAQLHILCTYPTRQKSDEGLVCWIDGTRYCVFGYVGGILQILSLGFQAARKFSPIAYCGT